jgi:nuclear pore complex protein Nup205
LLSETVLSSITKLREDRQHQIILQSVGDESESSSLPAEQLCNILCNILESILDNNHVELVRGNLYAALINFIPLMRSSHDIKASQESDANMFAMSISHSTMGDNLTFSGSGSLLPSKSGESLESTVSSLELGGLAVLKPVIDRLPVVTTSS